MNRHSINFKSKFLASLAVLASMTFSSCGLVTDDSDCVESYNLVKFVYDHNMKFTCAFDQQVEQVSLLLFDAKTGILSQRLDLPHADLNADNELVLKAEPGDYEMLVWAGTQTKENSGRASVKSFDDDYLIPEGKVGVSHIEDFTCYLKRDITADGEHHVNDVINDLWHSRQKISLPYASPSKPNKVTVPLKKNTNTFRIVLQQAMGGPVNNDDYELVITDNNGHMNADNSLREDNKLNYHPWFEMSGSVDVNSDPQDAPGSAKAPAWAKQTRTGIGASLWELTTTRLMMENDPRLIIRAKSDGRTILDISPKDYALLVKGFYNQKMDDQEYLDRQDEYNMTFFINNGKWLASVIIINNWRIVKNDVTAE